MSPSSSLVPTLRSAWSSWLEARVNYCRFTTDSSLAHHQHPHTRPRTHPQHARAHYHRKRLVIAPPLFHVGPSAPFQLPENLAARTAPFFFFFRVSTLLLAGRSFFLFASRCAGCSFFLLDSRCAARHARPQAKPRSLARTPNTDGRTTRRAVRRHG